LEGPVVLCRCGPERKAGDPRAAGGGGGVGVKPTGVWMEMPLLLQSNT